MRTSLAPSVLAVLAVLALAGCGGDEPDRPAGPPATVAPQERPPATVGAGGAGAQEAACEDVDVPGHRATEVTVTGASCADVRDVVEAAAGRGRAAYAAGGLRCTPSDAAGGDTDYVCAGRGVELAFLYGAV